MEDKSTVANAALKLAKIALGQSSLAESNKKSLPVAKSEYQINQFLSSPDVGEFNIEEVDDITFLEGYVDVPSEISTYRHLMGAIGRSNSIKQLFLHEATPQQWECLINALRINSSITKIHFSYNSMLPIGKAIKAHDMLTECSLILPDTVQNNEVEELARALTASKALKSIELRGPLLKSGVPSGQILSIFKALEDHGGLVKCAFNTITFSADTGDTLAGMIRYNEGLQSLSMIYCDIESLATPLSGALKLNTSITELDLSLSNFTFPSTINVLQIFKDNTTVTSLDLGGINMSSAAVVKELNEVLALNRTVKKLSLIDCQLCINDLAPGLTQNTTLTLLSLGRNTIRKQNMTSLWQSLRVPHLLLNDCKVDAGYMRDVFEGLTHNTSLLRLELRQVDLNAADLEALANMLRANTTLRALHFKRGTTVSLPMKPVFLALKENTALRELHIEKQKEQFHPEWDMVRDIIDDNYSLCKMTINFETDYGVDFRLQPNRDRYTGVIAFLKMMVQRPDVFFAVFPMEIWTKIFSYVNGVNIRTIFSTL